MYEFEKRYVQLVEEVLDTGEERVGRNGTTFSLFAKRLEIDMTYEENTFPLLLGRKIFHKGVLGEFAAFVRGPKCVEDFKKFGCNYWDLWAKEDGALNIDYGNSWLNFNGVNQLDQLRDSLVNNPKDRRMLISSWNPGNLAELSLPCCHLLYQWYVRDGLYLDMIWYQRSADTMIGIPSDIVLAALWNILLANNVGLKPGKITMIFGDTHIYAEHQDAAQQYVDNAYGLTNKDKYPKYHLHCPQGMKLEAFTPEMMSINGYTPIETIKFELKA